MPGGRLVRSLLEKVGSVERLTVKALLSDRIVLEGSVAVIEERQKAIDVYRGVYERYAPRTLGWIPGGLETWVSTNCPALIQEVPMNAPHFERMVRAAVELFFIPGSFDGEIAIAGTRLGGRSEHFLLISTRKAILPESTKRDLLSRIGQAVGEAAYSGDLDESPFYRVRSSRTGMKGYLWFAKETVVVASSEGALDSLASRRANPSTENPFTEQGDLFMVVDPWAAVGEAARTDGKNPGNLLRILGRIHLRFVMGESGIEMSGHTALRPAERN
jgi:hypothetical protein